VCLHSVMSVCFSLAELVWPQLVHQGRFVLERISAFRVSNANNAQDLAVLPRSQRTVQRKRTLRRCSSELGGQSCQCGQAGTCGQAPRRNGCAMGSEPWVLNTPDGTMDLTTGDMRPHPRKDYFSMTTAVDPPICPAHVASVSGARDWRQSTEPSPPHLRPARNQPRPGRLQIGVVLPKARRRPESSDWRPP
jgi:hypothetical protein